MLHNCNIKKLAIKNHFDLDRLRESRFLQLVVLESFTLSISSQVKIKRLTTFDSSPRVQVKLRRRCIRIKVQLQTVVHSNYENRCKLGKIKIDVPNTNPITTKVANKTTIKRSLKRTTSATTITCSIAAAV